MLFHMKVKIQIAVAYNILLEHSHAHCFCMVFGAFCAMAEKEMATHSSVLAWRTPGTGVPGGHHLWGHTESDMTEAT